MGNYQPVFDSYRLGMKRDFPREQMPEGTMWNLVDFLPDVANASLRGRGGWTYASQDISSVTATASQIAVGIFAPFSAGNSILAWDEDGRCYEVESITGTENIAATNLPKYGAVFYNNMVIIPDGLSGSSAPGKITRSGGTHTFAALGGSPPAGRYMVVYKDVLWNAAPAASSDRIFFSAAGSPETTWDTTNKYLDSSYPITGMVAMQNAVFVFSLGRTMRVRGSVPPPDSDFIVDDPIFEVGCTDARSIATYRDKIIWANAQGIYISDGSALEDLTRICGMKSWWRDVLANGGGFTAGNGTTYSPSLWTICGGVYGDYYFYNVMDAGANYRDSGFIDLTKYAWHRHANMRSQFFFQRPYPEELFFGHRTAARVGQMSPIFAPAAANSADADGVAVAPYVEFPYWQGEAPGVKTFRGVAVGYDIRDPGSSNPTLTVSYVDTPEETSYTALSPVLAETTQYERVRRALNFPAQGIGLKIAQSGASSDTRLYAVELDAFPRDTAR